MGTEFLTSLVRRKRVDHEHGTMSSGGQHLAKALTFSHLLALGVGSTIGAGIYILVGTVARENTGPALALSFLIAGIAAGLSAFCYAELASRCPSAGSAYYYSYICLGESRAWFITESAVLVFVVTGLLCYGIKESTFAQGIVTIGNVCAMIFVIIAGGYIGFKTGWPGYKLSSGYIPFGVDGILTGSATVFFAYIGFDALTCTAEEVKNPQRDLPLGIAASLSVCCALYMLVSIVIVGIVPYYLIDSDTPISSAFAGHGMQWAGYIVAVGAITALCSTLIGSILPQPRILMAMARDGLLPSLFSDVSKNTQVPVKGTIATRIVAALLAFCMDVSQLAEMVSVSTLLVFTVVAISLLVIRYVPPQEAPLPSSLEESIHAVSLRNGGSSEDFGIKDTTSEPLLEKVEFLVHFKELVRGNYEIGNDKRRRIAGWTIMLTCVGVLLLASAASHVFPSMLRYMLCAVGGGLLLSGLTVLTCIDQDNARHNFGYTGGFICPLVPLLPIICILINVYLLINIGLQTWIRVSVWLFVGVLVYLFYGHRYSSLGNTHHVPTTYVEQTSTAIATC